MDLVGALPEGDFVCRGFGHVVQLGAGTVGIDIHAVLLGVVAGLVEGLPDTGSLGASVRAGRRGVVRVAGAPVTGNLGIDMRTALECVLKLLKDEDGAAVGHHESAPVGIEGQAGALGILGAGKRSGVTECCGSYGNGAMVGASGNDCVGVAVLDGPESFSDGVGGGGAGGDDTDAGALRTVFNGNLASCHIGYHGRDEQGRNPLSAGIFHHFGHFTLNGFESADSGAHVGR